MKPKEYFDTLHEILSMDEGSARKKLADLSRKLRRRYYVKKPMAAAFADPNLPPETSLTETVADKIVRMM